MVASFGGLAAFGSWTTGWTWSSRTASMREAEPRAVRVMVPTMQPGLKLVRSPARLASDLASDLFFQMVGRAVLASETS